MIDGVVVRSSDVQFHESPALSVAPVVAHECVSADVPTPELPLSDIHIHDELNFKLFNGISDDTLVGVRHFQQDIAPGLELDVAPHDQSVHILPVNNVGWPIEQVPQVQQLVPIQHAGLLDNAANVPMQPVHAAPQLAVQPEIQEALPETHAGRPRRHRDPGWRAAHIPGYEPASAATVDTNSVPIPAFQKQSKPG